jgi:FkbM family methyltransferase
MNIINKILQKRGIIIKRFPEGNLLRRQLLIRHYNIDLVLDVGASVGKYAEILREIGYKEDIISFEPIKKSHQILEKKTQQDSKWLSYNYALGKKNAEQSIYISSNYDSSSLLKISEIHARVQEKSKIIGEEKVIVKKMDDIFPEISKEKKNIYLKLDTQGFEMNILAGAENSLEQIKVLQIELSIFPLYEGSENYQTIISYLEKKGFMLFGIEPGFYDKKSGRLLQFDGLFINQKNH